MWATLRGVLLFIIITLPDVTSQQRKQCPVESAFDTLHDRILGQCEPEQVGAGIDLKLSITDGAPGDTPSSKGVAVELEEAPWTQFRFTPHSAVELSTASGERLTPNHYVVTSRLFVLRTDTILLCLYLGLRNSGISTRSTRGIFLVLRFKSNPLQNPLQIRLPLLSFEYPCDSEVGVEPTPADRLLNQPEVIELLLRDSGDTVTAVDWTLTDKLDIAVAAGLKSAKLSLHKLNIAAFLSTANETKADSTVQFGAGEVKYPVSAVFRARHSKSEYIFFAYTNNSMEVYRNGHSMSLGLRKTDDPIVSFIAGGPSGQTPYFFTTSRIGQVRMDVLSNRTEEWFATCRAALWHAAPLFATTRSLQGGHASSSNSLVQNFAFAFPEGMIGIFSARRESYRTLQCSELGYFRVITVSEDASVQIHGQCFVGDFLVVLASAVESRGPITDVESSTNVVNGYLVVYEIPMDNASSGKHEGSSSSSNRGVRQNAGKHYSKSNSAAGFLNPSMIRRTTTHKINNMHMEGEDNFALGSASLSCEALSAYEAIATVTSGPSVAVEIVHMRLPLTSTALDVQHDSRGYYSPSGSSSSSSWTAGGVDFTLLLRSLTPIPVIFIIAFQVLKHVRKHRRRSVDEAESEIALRRYEKHRTQLDRQESDTNKERRVKFSLMPEEIADRTTGVLNKVISAEELSTDSSRFGKWGEVSNSLFNARLRAAKEIRRRPLVRPQTK